MEEIPYYSVDDAQRILDQALNAEQASGDYLKQPEFGYCILEEPLTSAEDPLENYTTAKARKLRYTNTARTSGGTVNFLDMEEVPGTEGEMILVNRFAGLDIDTGTTVYYRRDPREYVPIVADCPPTSSSSSTALGGSSSTGSPPLPG